MKHFMIILDTSFLAAYFRKSDVHHSKAVELAKRHSEEKLIISFLVFQEFISHLNRKASSELANSVAKFLLSKDSKVEVYKLDEIYMDEVLALYETLSPHLFSYVDVSLIQIGRAHV